MPADAIPFVIAVVMFFGAFIVAVGGAALWTALPPPGSRAGAKPKSPAPAGPAAPLGAVAPS